MKLISWNVNGIRSVHKKGFLNFLSAHSPDILFLQEIKSNLESIPLELVTIQGYHSFFSCAQKKGYSGLAAYSKIKPLATRCILGETRFDSEGRILELSFPDYKAINIYMPHGGREKQNLEYKLNSYTLLESYLLSLATQNTIIAGDFNIAHTENDLARPKGNKDNIMFTPLERARLDNLSTGHYYDSFRLLHSENGHYSWWPYRKGLREQNIGWRIDYAWVSNPLKDHVKEAVILPQVFGSDHCPISLTLW